jgi:hypothetical protein
MSPTELIRAIRAEGHMLSVRDGKVQLRPLGGSGSKVAPELTEALREHRDAVYQVLTVAEVRGAMYRAVDVIAADWPRTGPQPEPSMEAIAAEAELDDVLTDEPMDTAVVHAAIKAWQRAWVECVKGVSR